MRPKIESWPVSAPKYAYDSPLSTRCARRCGHRSSRTISPPNSSHSRCGGRFAFWLRYTRLAAEPGFSGVSVQESEIPCRNRYCAQGSSKGVIRRSDANAVKLVHQGRSLIRSPRCCATGRAPCWRKRSRQRRVQAQVDDLLTPINPADIAYRYFLR
jgi:hypothetical protein